MTSRWVGTFLLCVGALNALIGTIMVIQLPTAHIGVFPYVILISGLALMLGGYVTGRRRDGS